MYFTAATSLLYCRCISQSYKNNVFIQRRLQFLAGHSTSSSHAMGQEGQTLQILLIIKVFSKVFTKHIGKLTYQQLFKNALKM